MYFLPKMKALKAYAAVAFASAAIFAGNSSVEAQQIDWNYLNDSPVRFEWQENIGNEPGVQDGYHLIGAFASVLDNADQILFIDGNANSNYQTGNWSGSIGAGYRQNVGAAVVGGNAYYNIRDYSNDLNDHSFSTLGFGAEALMPGWALRTNAWFSLSDQQSNGLTATPLMGGPILQQEVGADLGVQNILLATQTENSDEALDGFDLTASANISTINTEVGAGVYYLSAGGGPDTWGVTGSAETWITPNLAANVNVSHDDFFDTTVYGGVSLYFGGPAIDVRSRSNSVVSRLWSRVQRRDVVPVYNYTLDAPDLFATDSTSGDLISVVQIGTGEDILGAPNLMEGDGDFVDIILVDAGSVFTPMDTIVLNDDQRLLSAHLEHFVETTESGLILLPESGLGGAAAMITGEDDEAIIELANGNEVSGFSLVAGNDGDGIFGDDVTGFNINNNTLDGATNSASDGILIRSSGIDVSGVIVSNTATGFNHGLELEGMDFAVDILDNVFTGNGGDGVDIDGSGNFSGLISGNTFSDNSQDGLEFDALTISGRIVDNIANANGQVGLSIEITENVLPGSVLNITENTTNLNGSDGIDILFSGTFDSEVFIDDNTADGNGSDGISVITDGSGDILGQISNNTTNGNSFAGIVLATNDPASNINVDVLGNVSSSNDSEGLLIAADGNFTGTIDSNVFSLNGRDGLKLFVDGALDANITGNTLLGNGSDGAELFGSDDITGEISGNMASNNGAAGLFALTEGSINLDVLNNTANDNNDLSFNGDDGGISLVADGNVAGIVDGNTTNDNDQFGIRIIADDNGGSVGDVTATVSNNTANDNGDANGDAGISISGENVSSNIVSNVANDNGGGGIVVDAVNNALLGNVVDNETNDNDDTGISITAGNDIRAFALVNEASGNDGDGIFFDAGNDFIGDIFSNTTSNNTDNGISVTAASSILQFTLGLGVRNNTADNNGADGINLDAANIGSMVAPFQITGNMIGQVAGNGLVGLRINAVNDIFANVDNNLVSASLSTNILVTAGNDLNGTVSGNTANGSVTGSGIIVSAVGDVHATVSNNIAGLTAMGGLDGNNFNGITILGANITGDVSNNQALDNGGAGIVISALNDITSTAIANNFAGTDTATAMIVGGNAGDGLVITAMNDINSAIELNVLNNNTGNGLSLTVGNNAAGSATFNFAIDNGGFGFDSDAVNGTTVGGSPNFGSGNTSGDFGNTDGNNQIIFP